MTNEEPPPTNTPRRRRVALIALAVAGLVVVAGALVWAALDDPDDAQVDAEQSCELVERLPDEMTRETRGGDSERDYLRLSAAHSLAVAAKRGDDEYAALADVATAALNEQAAELEISRDSLDDLRSACDEIS